jgi:hypothetical protein
MGEVLRTYGTALKNVEALRKERIDLILDGIRRQAGVSKLTMRS